MLIGFLERALIKAENFKIENLEKLSDEGKNEKNGYLNFNWKFEKIHY